MSSSNPYGLSEINHYGSMQRVGGKAAGFINKKFFHPSSLRNQEKLWKAQTAQSIELKRQADAEKRREEERKVEALKKQMYLAGQSSPSDLLFAKPGEIQTNKGKKSEQQKAFEEQRRRKARLKEERAAKVKREAVENADGEIIVCDEDNVEPEAEDPRTLVNSQYAEDIFVNGHISVWGSWYSLDGGHEWGFSCCKVTERGQRCPHAPKEEEDADKEKRKRGEPRGKRRRRGGAESSLVVVDGVGEADIVTNISNACLNEAASSSASANCAVGPPTVVETAEVVCCSGAEDANARDSDDGKDASSMQISAAVVEADRGCEACDREAEVGAAEAVDEGG